MPDILLDGLPVIDLLEVSANTSAVAQWTRRDQSSVSRIYRQVSSQLGLGFGKQRDGLYRAGANQELLESLRQSSQWLRLHRQPCDPRWVGYGGNQPLHGGLPPLLPPALERSWSQEQRTAALLQQRVLDLAVVPLTAAPSPESPLSAVPLAHYPLLLAAHPQHPLQAVARPSPEQLAVYPVQRLKETAAPAPDPQTLLCLSPLQLWQLRRQQPLVPLPVDSGHRGTDGILVLDELLASAAIAQLINAIRAGYRRHFGGLAKLEWIS